jgi:glucoamylase
MEILLFVGEVDLSKETRFLIGIGFGHSPQSSSTKLLQSLSFRFEEHRDQYVRQWKRTMPGGELDLRKHTGDGGGIYRLSRLILLAHEDKIYPGALVASMSIPWGETRATRTWEVTTWCGRGTWSKAPPDCWQQADKHSSSLPDWLASMQRPDGSMPQNSWINGDAYWHGKQLDEVAAPSYWPGA